MEPYKQQIIETERIKTAYYRVGEGNKKKLLVLHGNLSSSVFFMPLAPYLEKDFDIAIPDLRCFGHTEALSIDATRGYRDWSDDIFAFCQAIGWKKFTLLGWSMGGDIAMQFVIDHSKMVEKLVLVAPGSPYGFGGTMDEKGTPYMPLGLGSGGGIANPAMLLPTSMGSRVVLRDLLHRYLFSSDFRMSLEWENRFIDATSQMKIGVDYYPGDFDTCARWPFVVAGDKGVLNTMSPKYGNLEAFLDIEKKPEVLWIHGDCDQIVSDESMMDFAYLGKIGLVPGYPGEDDYPPQPMIRQTRYFFEQYKEKGGFYVEAVIPGGHVCILESPVHFISALQAFTQSRA